MASKILMDTFPLGWTNKENGKMYARALKIIAVYLLLSVHVSNILKSF